MYFILQPDIIQLSVFYSTNVLYITNCRGVNCRGPGGQLSGGQLLYLALGFATIDPSVTTCRGSIVGGLIVGGQLSGGGGGGQSSRYLLLSGFSIVLRILI